MNSQQVQCIRPAFQTLNEFEKFLQKFRKPLLFINHSLSLFVFRIYIGSGSCRMPKLRASATARSRQTYARAVCKKPSTFLHPYPYKLPDETNTAHGIGRRASESYAPSSSPCAALQSNSVSTEPSASAVSFGSGQFGCVGFCHTLIKFL